MMLLAKGERGRIYEELYEAIRRKIIQGEWESGKKLPSSRQLALELSISRNTVERAYLQLHEEGYLVSKARSGYFVEKLDLRFAAEPAEKMAWDEAGKKPEDLAAFDFRYGKLDYRTFPFTVWNRLMQRCLRDELEGLSSYGNSQGEEGLRREIVRYVGEVRGVRCSPEQVIVGAGTLHCLTLLANILRREGTGIAFEEPGYQKSRAVCKNFDLPVYPIPIGKDGLEVERLWQVPARAVYITPSHQFPTGAVMPVGARLRLLEWAEERDGIIIEDDYACHFRYNIRPIPAIQGLAGGERVVYLGTFSKPLLPSMRLAYMVLPERLREKYRVMYQDYNSAVPFVSQRTLELFMAGGYWERHLRRMAQVYKRRHDHLICCLREQLGSQVEICGKDAGLFVTIRVKNGMGERELIRRAAERGVRVYPVSVHWEKAADYDGKMVLLGFSSLNERELEAGVGLLKQAWIDTMI